MASMAFQDTIPQTRPYGYCDTYFIEEDTESRVDREKEQKAARQREMDDLIAKVTAYQHTEESLEHMKYMETETMADVNSIDIQTEIQWYMRPYLLDFLIEAHAAFQLLPETLFLTINLLDRYCSRRVVYKRHYQLVGCAALLIASKYGDKKEKVPTVRELRSMCCSLYEEDMFIQMEWHVLQTLNWVIGHPTIDSFLAVILEQEGQKDLEVQHMTLFISEMALFHREFVTVSPSVIARSALALSRCILGRNQTRLTGWAGEYDATVILALANYLTSPSQVLSRKYSTTQLCNVATTVAMYIEEQNRKTQAPIHAASPAPSAGYANSNFPQTPQKQPYGAAVMSNGFLTPPITPENEQGFPMAGYNKPAMPAPTFPPTPSPIAAPQHSTGPSPASLHPHSYQPPYMQPQFAQ